MIRAKTLATAVAFIMLAILPRQTAAGTSTPAELIAATTDAFRSKNKFGADAMTSSVPPGLGTRMMDVTFPNDEWVMFEEPEKIAVEETGAEAVATETKVEMRGAPGEPKAEVT